MAVFRQIFFAFTLKYLLTRKQTGVILLGRMRKRGKYGLTIVFNTNKIGGFRPFSLVCINLLTAATRCPGSNDPQQDELQQLLVRSQRIQTPKTPEKYLPPQLGVGPLGISSRGRPVPKLVTYQNRRNVGILLREFGSLHETQLPGPVRNLCQALFVHRLWITTGVWEFVGFCQVNQRSGRPGDWTTP